MPYTATKKHKISSYWKPSSKSLRIISSLDIPSGRGIAFTVSQLQRVQGASLSGNTAMLNADVYNKKQSAHARNDRMGERGVRNERHRSGSTMEVEVGWKRKLDGDGSGWPVWATIYIGESECSRTV